MCVVMYLGPDVPVGCRQEAHCGILVLSVLVYVLYMTVANQKLIVIEGMRKVRLQLVDVQEQAVLQWLELKHKATAEDNEVN